MNIRARLFAVILGIVLFTIVLSLWRYISLESQAHHRMTVETADQYSGLARQLVTQVNQRLQAQLMDQISREQNGRSQGLSQGVEEELQRELGYGPFQAVALLKTSGARWHTGWLRQRAQGRWPEGFFKSVLEGLAPQLLGQQKLRWQRFMDPAQRPGFLLLTPLKDGADTVIAVGVVAPTALNIVADAFAGRKAEVMVVDEDGFAVALSEPAYVGARVSESHPPVSESLKTPTQAHFLTEDRQHREVVAAVQKVADSNLLVITTVPQTRAWALIPRLILTAVFLLVVMGCVGVAAGLWTLAPLEQALTYFTQQFSQMADGQPVRFLPSGNPFLEPQRDVVERLMSRASGMSGRQAETEKFGAYQEIVLGLAQSLKDPLAAVLAQAQLARSRGASDEAKDHLSAIERETRRARDTIENLLRLAGEERFPRALLDVNEVVRATLQTQMGLLNSHNVKVVEELDCTQPALAHFGQLQTVFEEIIKNAVEAMANRADERCLRVRAVAEENGVLIQIEDNGLGLGPEALTKVFDPFYTTKNQAAHKGLGLTVAKGIMKTLEGQLRFESKGSDQGSKVSIELPRAVSAAVEVVSLPSAAAAKPAWLPEPGWQTTSGLELHLRSPKVTEL